MFSELLKELNVCFGHLLELAASLLLNYLLLPVFNLELDVQLSLVSGLYNPKLTNALLNDLFIITVALEEDLSL